MIFTRLIYPAIRLIDTNIENNPIPVLDLTKSLVMSEIELKIKSNTSRIMNTYTDIGIKIEECFLEDNISNGFNNQLNVLLIIKFFYLKLPQKFNKGFAIDAYKFLV